MNAGCTNSRGAGTTWVQRIMTQEDRLLHNPNFADPGDSQWEEITGLNFKDMLREALAIEVSSKKGDWSIPTEQEISQRAAELVGIPRGFEASDPQPPARLVDEVVERDQDFEQIPKEDYKIVPLGPPGPNLGGDRFPEPAPEPATPKPKGEWRIRGDSGTPYDVTLHQNGDWECSCPSRENPCKHSRDIALRLSRAPAESPPEPRPRPVLPPPVPAQTTGLAGNTQVPEQGQTIGGAPPETVTLDPWAPPEAVQGRVIPVGGRVSFKSGKKD